jgi:hypothetical protein
MRQGERSSSPSPGLAPVVVVAGGQRLSSVGVGAMLSGMIIVFEVHLVPAHSNDFLSTELVEDTGAQVMTPAAAKAVGFEGIPDDPTLRLVAVAVRDKGLVQSALDRAADVTGYRVHEVDM